MSNPWRRWAPWLLILGIAAVGCKAKSKQQFGPLDVGSECPAIVGRSLNGVTVDKLEPPGLRVYVVNPEFPSLCLDVECLGTGPVDKRLGHTVGISDPTIARLFGAEKDGEILPLVVVCDPADSDAEIAGRVRAIYPGAEVADLERILTEQGL